MPKYHVYIPARGEAPNYTKATWGADSPEEAAHDRGFSIANGWEATPQFWLDEGVEMSVVEIVDGQPVGPTTRYVVSSSISISVDVAERQ